MTSQKKKCCRGVQAKLVSGQPYLRHGLTKTDTRAVITVNSNEKKLPTRVVEDPPTFPKRNHGREVLVKLCMLRRVMGFLLTVLAGALGERLRCRQQAYATCSDAADHQPSCYLQLCLFGCGLPSTRAAKVSPD